MATATGQGIEWHTQKGLETVIRDAAARLAAAQETRKFEVADPTKPTESNRRVAVVASWFMLVAVAGFMLATGSSRALGCEPITYALAGSPPSHARAEISAAIDEIHRRTGLIFEKGDPAKSTLTISWSQRGVTNGMPSSVASGADTPIGFGFGRWRNVAGGRVLVGAVVEIDANVPWELGFHRGSGLGAAMVHELGHVVGLDHSAEPTSFMSPRSFPQTPRWTAQEIGELAEAGRRSGCRARARLNKPSSAPR